MEPLGNLTPCCKDRSGGYLLSETLTLTSGTLVFWRHEGTCSNTCKTKDCSCSLVEPVIGPRVDPKSLGPRMAWVLHEPESSHVSFQTASSMCIYIYILYLLKDIYIYISSFVREKVHVKSESSPVLCSCVAWLQALNLFEEARHLGIQLRLGLVVFPKPLKGWVPL